MSLRQSKAVMQVLLARELISDANLRDAIAMLRDEAIRLRKPLPASVLPADIFRRLNAELRIYSMEVKSVRDFDATFYHSIVNTEEDFVAKLYGYDFDEKGIRFFRSLLSKLVASKQSTDEIQRDLKGTNLNHAEIESALTKLNESNYIRRDHRGFWELGLKSHMELRAAIEDSIHSYEDEEKESEGETQQGNSESKLETVEGSSPRPIRPRVQLAIMLENLPQMIIY
jgi:hypothetical protein